MNMRVDQAGTDDPAGEINFILPVVCPDSHDLVTGNGNISPAKPVGKDIYIGGALQDQVCPFPACRRIDLSAQSGFFLLRLAGLQRFFHLNCVPPFLQNTAGRAWRLPVGRCQAPYGINYLQKLSHHSSCSGGICSSIPGESRLQITPRVGLGNSLRVRMTRVGVIM